MKKGNLATQHIFALKAAKALDFQVQKHSTSLFKHTTALTIELFEDLLALELKNLKTKPYISKMEVTICKYDSYVILQIFYRTTLKKDTNVLLYIGVKCYLNNFKLYPNNLNFH